MPYRGLALCALAAQERASAGDAQAARAAVTVGAQVAVGATCRRGQVDAALARLTCVVGAGRSVLAKKRPGRGAADELEVAAVGGTGHRRLAERIAQAADAVATVAAVQRAGVKALALVAGTVAASAGAVARTHGGSAVADFAHVVAAHLLLAICGAEAGRLALLALLVAARLTTVGRAGLRVLTAFVAHALAVAAAAAAVGLANLGALAGRTHAVAASVAVDRAQQQCLAARSRASTVAAHRGRQVAARAGCAVVGGAGVAVVTGQGSASDCRQAR